MVDRGTAEMVAREAQAEIMLEAQDLETGDRLGNDFGPDSVTGQDCDLGHAASTFLMFLTRSSRTAWALLAASM